MPRAPKEPRQVKRVLDKLEKLLETDSDGDEWNLQTAAFHQLQNEQQNARGAPVKKQKILENCAKLKKKIMDRKVPELQKGPAIWSRQFGKK